MSVIHQTMNNIKVYMSDVFLFVSENLHDVLMAIQVKKIDIEFSSPCFNRIKM